MKSLRFFMLTMLLTSAPGAAQDFPAGLFAARSGDYETALREWMPLAE